MYSTFQSCYQEVLNRTRSLPQQSYLSPLKNAVNAVYQELCSWREWPFLQKTGRLTLVAPVNSGTLSGTAGGNQLSGTGTAFTLDMVGWYLRYGADNALYEITGVDPVGQVLTVSPSLSLTGVALDYSVFPFSYQLPSDFRMPEPITAFQLSPKMRFVGTRELQSDLINTRFGNPDRWSIAYRSSAPQTPQMVFFPFPSQPIVVQFLYLPQLPDLQGDSDPILIPSNYRRAIIEGAMAIFYRDVLDDPARAQISKAEYIQIRNQMCTDYGLWDDQPQLRPASFRGLQRRFGTDAVIERMVWRV